MSILPISDVVNIVVTLSPTAAIRSGFNLGLIIGASTIISGNTRVTEYSSLTEMFTAGFTAESPEYLAAQAYFAQTPKPLKVAIGVKTAEETWLQAVTACRAKNQEWYVCTICSVTKADIEAVAAYIESCSPNSVFFYATEDADTLAGTEGNVFSALKALEYKRSLGVYSAGGYTVAASIIGYAMGANTKLANSAYTLAYKSLPGVSVDDLTSAQVSIVKGNNGNVYICRGNTYNVFEQGITADGTHFDEILGLDMLVNYIQFAVMDLLTGVPKIPYADEGVTQLISAITGPLDDAVDRGFITPGVWRAATILSLNTGDMLTKGYLILADSVADQSSDNIANRIAPPIYIPVKLAGAIEFVTINLLVNL